jgi:hypothetical protein
VYDPDFIGVRKHVKRLVSRRLMDKGALESDGLDPGKNYFVVMPAKGLIGKGEKHPVFVSYSAFDIYSSEQYFLNSLIAHEGMHCTDLMDGIRLQDGTLINYKNVGQLQRDTLYYVAEIRGYHNQSIQGKKQGIRDRKFYQYNERRIEDQIDCLMSLAPESELDERIIKNPMIAYWHMK